ncbi:MAG: glycoside hydrolase family 44 protein, partial [Myxococcales bacterium]
ARLDLAGYGGWILANPGFSGDFGALVFRFRASERFGDALEVRLDAPVAQPFPRIRPGKAHRRALGDGWHEIRLPMRELNPDGRRFDRILFHAALDVREAKVEIDQVRLEPAGGGQTEAPAPEERGALLRIDLTARGHRISPLIYGIAFDPRLDGRDTHQLTLGATARRWGGNPSSRYNWRLGNAWNTASDWFFRNVDFTGIPGFTYQRFLDANLERGLASALTVPLLGWAAKDTSSFSFPVSKFGPQRRTDPDFPDAGDGFSPSGSPLMPGPATATSVEAPPESIGEWVKAIRARDEERGRRSVQMYILDNEPMLWSSTHRDVHPDPVGYDELLQRTVDYATAIRKADPKAVIAGPALWGWPAYFYSAKDAAAGFVVSPDRTAHGGEPLLAWYLHKLEEHRKRTGTRLLDVVDVHFYPQASGMGVGREGDTSPEGCARRLRATRALWDPSYVDESWIGEPVRLIPRVREWIAQNAPGLGLSIGEYNFGAEGHLCGGLALAEVLGRFGEQRLDAAFYWTYPAAGSPAYWAFRAFRDYDGEGARFLDISLPTRATEGVSLFASTDEQRRRVVAIALNLQPATHVNALLELAGCRGIARRRAFALGPERGRLEPIATPAAEGCALRQSLPPYSLTVLELELSGAAKE